MRAPLIIEAPLLVTTVVGTSSLEALSNPQLLSAYNAVTGRATSKFATRRKALEQTFLALKNVVAVDLRETPPVVYRDGDVLPEGVSTPIASGSSPVDLARSEEPLEQGSTEEITDQVIPGSRGAGKVGRPHKYKARKQADGTYVFDMPPRAQRAKPGGRRPELIEMLRKRPTFRQLVNRFKPRGETDEERFFNLATTVTCMGGTCGYGIVTAADGRIDLLEPTELRP